MGSADTAAKAEPPVAATAARYGDPGYWDDVVRGWQATQRHRLWRAHSDAVNSQLLERLLRPDTSGSVLKTDLFDEAVGHGLFPMLAARFSRVVGVDISAVAVHDASRRYADLEAHVGSVLDLPFDDGSFDAIVSNSTLDHFETHRLLRAAVAELARLLRPGGQLLITLDNRSNPVIALRTSRLCGVLERLGVVPYFVGATYGAPGLHRTLREAGFVVARSAVVMHCPPQLAAVWSGRPGRSAPISEPDHLRRVLAFERMADWPTAHLTGHFVAALAYRV